MVTHEEIDEFFRRLPAAAAAPAAGKQKSPDQSRQLLSAFNKITDPRLRRELLTLIEIVSQMPEVLQRGSDRNLAGVLAQMH